MLILSKVLWTIDSVPCKNNGEVEPVDAAFVKVSDLSSEKGVVIRCVDFAPGGKAVSLSGSHQSFRRLVGLGTSSVDGHHR
jgi:hypothetical protein